MVGLEWGFGCGEVEWLVGMLGCECGRERTNEVAKEIFWVESREALEVRSCGFCVGVRE